MRNLTIAVDTLPNETVQDTFYDALSQAPVSVMLFEHRLRTNNVIVPADVNYFSTIPAYLTRGNTNTPSRSGHPE